MPLQDQVILITGCSTGIGRALAEELSARKQRVVATARKLSALTEVPAVQKLELDVTDASSIANAVSQVLATHGRIDMLINNAGFILIGPLAELPLADARRLFDTNLVGPVAMTQAVFPIMAERRSGRIVNIGSVVGLLPTPFAGAYCASKAAVHMLSEVLRMEVAPFGIDVIEVQPGGVRSKLSENASAGVERYRSPASRYRRAYKGIEKRANSSQHNAMDSRAFAAKVADALLADRPSRIVRAGNGAKLYPALSKVPGTTRDKILGWQFGLGYLRSR